MAEQGSISTEVLPFPATLLEDGSLILGQLRAVLWESQPMGWQPGGLHCAGAADHAGSSPCRAGKFPWRDQHSLHGQTCPVTSQPQQLPASSASQGQNFSHMAARHQAEQESEEEEEQQQRKASAAGQKEQQGQKGLSFKCLRSFRHKISGDNWRKLQDPGLEAGSKVSSGGGSW